MCGRFTLTVEPDALLRELGLDPPEGFAPRYNIAPTQNVLAVAEARDGERRLGLLRWGLVPYWAEDASGGARTINARSESVATRRPFREAFDRRRCLVLADGFYEWRRDHGRKVPLRFVRPDGLPFTFAGLWERWRQEDGTHLHTCTILTTRPNAAVAPVHDRMPVIIAPEDRARWLDHGSSGAAVADLLHPPADDALEGYEVRDLVNAVANDVPAVIAPRPPDPPALTLFP
jgi:putative SOS response-associated peptidase YedK